MLAIAAIIIEKFDERYVPLRVAESGAARRIENQRLVRGDRRALLFCFFRSLQLLELFERVAQHFRMLHEIILDDRLDLGAILVGKRARGCRREGESGRGERGGSEGKTAKRHGNSSGTKHVRASAVCNSQYRQT